MLWRQWLTHPVPLRQRYPGVPTPRCGPPTIAFPAQSPMSWAMSDAEFDKALLRAAFALAGAAGWDAVTVAEAARSANLDLARARETVSRPRGDPAAARPVGRPGGARAGAGRGYRA